MVCVSKTARVVVQARVAVQLGFDIAKKFLLFSLSCTNTNYDNFTCQDYLADMLDPFQWRTYTSATRTVQYKSVVYADL